MNYIDDEYTAFDEIFDEKQREKKMIPMQIIDDIKAEIDNQYKWLMQTKHTLNDIDIAFDAIKSLLDKYIRKEQE